MITLTDAAGNSSTALQVPEFTVNIIDADGDGLIEISSVSELAGTGIKNRNRMSFSDLSWV